MDDGACIQEDICHDLYGEQGSETLFLKQKE